MEAASVVEQQQTVPGLQEFFRKAFNAKSGNFLGAYVFAPFTFNDTTEPWGPEGHQERYPLPEDFSFDGTWNSNDVYVGQYLSTSEDYDSSFSITVEAEASYAGFSASANSSYFRHDHSFSSHDTAFTMDYLVASAYTARRLVAVPAEELLDAEFLRRVSALPRSLDGGGLQSYFDFFGTFGTHYLIQAPFGGVVFMTSTVAKSVYDDNHAQAIANSVHAAFDKGLASGSLTVDAVVTSMDATTREEVTVSDDLQYIGGMPHADKYAWQMSLYLDPAPVIGLPNNVAFGRPVFNEIADLVSDPTLSQNVKTALTQYLPASHPTIIAATPVQPGIVRQATGSGFVVAYVDASPDGGAHQTDVNVFAGPDQNPNGVRAAGIAQVDGDGGINLPTASATAPIRKGEYYVAQPPTPGTNAVAQFNPLSSSSFDFGEPQQNFPAAGTAASDGFLAVTLAVENQGARASVFGSLDGQRVSACSVHLWWEDRRFNTRQSFCMPVLHGRPYEVDLAPSDGSASDFDLTVTWVPLTENVFGGTIETRDAGRGYAAETDGILFGWLESEDLGLGTIAVRVGAEGEDPGGVETAPVVQKASAELWTFSDVWAPRAAVMVPVYKDQPYAVDLGSNGRCQANLFWVSIQD